MDHLELWIDGSKTGNYPGNTVSTQVPLANGPHTASLVEVDSSWNYLKSTPVTFAISNTGGSCSAPSSPGAVLCSPAPGSTASSPVQFSGAGKAASGSVDHLELWVDGNKIGNYPGSAMTAGVALSSGAHSASVVEVDSSWNYLKSAPVSFTAGSGSGACAPPSGTGAILCSPAPGSSVGSPVQFSGAGSAGGGTVDHLELWVDGNKIGNYPGSTMTASVTFGSGQHTATLVEVNTAYQPADSAPVTFNVQ